MSEFHHSKRLAQNGFLNIYTPDVRDLIGRREDLHLVGYCSSFACNGTLLLKLGLPVLFQASGRKSNHCPKCENPIIAYDMLNDRELKKAKTRFEASLERKKKRA